MKWLFEIIGSFIPAWDWKDIFAKHGLATIGVVALFFYFVIPARNDAKRFTDSVIETNKTRAESEAKYADAFGKMIPILDRIDRNTSK